MLIIGENIHIIAPPVKAAIEARDAGTIQRMAVAQVEAGAGVVDLNIGPQKKLGHEVMPWIVEAVQEVVDVPLSLDTTNFAAMEAGLKVCKKPAMLNSASADPDRLDSVMQLAARYGAKVIALTMGVDGIPTTADGRAGIAMEDSAAGRRAGRDSRGGRLSRPARPRRELQPGRGHGDRRGGAHVQDDGRPAADHGDRPVQHLQRRPARGPSAHQPRHDGHGDGRGARQRDRRSARQRPERVDPRGRAAR